jgi:hypothetical protein
VVYKEIKLKEVELTEEEEEFKRMMEEKKDVDPKKCKSN